MFPAKKIVCPTDFSGGSFQALAQATELALQFGAEIYLLHVIPFLQPAAEPGISEMQKGLNDDAEDRLRNVAEPLTAIGLSTQIAVGDGDPATEIVRIAEELGADLIVIATHGNTGWRHMAFGSVTEKVVRLATCPVLTIRMTSEQATNATRAA